MDWKPLFNDLSESDTKNYMHHYTNVFQTCVRGPFDPINYLRNFLDQYKEWIAPQFDTQKYGEPWSSIFNHLDIADLYSFSQTNKNFSTMVPSLYIKPICNIFTYFTRACAKRRLQELKEKFPLVKSPTMHSILTGTIRDLHQRKQELNRSSH